MQRSECLKLIAVMVAGYPRAKFNQANADAYAAALVDLDREAMALAVQSLTRTHKWLPSIAEIRAAAVNVSCGERPLALAAWGSVCGAAERRGSYWSPKFRDPITQKCVESMGWRYLCRSTSDASDRARFVELYDQLAERERRAKVVALPASNVRHLPRKGER